MKKELERREQLQQQMKRSDSNDNHLNGNPNMVMNDNEGLNDGAQNPYQSALANIFIFIGFAAFAYTVKYVLLSISAE